jgi:signal transduction histidine kinase
MLVERTVRREGSGDARWRLLVASDLGDANDAVARFDGVLVASLAVLLIMLGAAAVAQVAIGLAPLRGLQRALAAVREGRTAGLQGRFPTEVQPLVDEFNGVLDRNAEIVARARTQAGNLAHAIKTPLAAMAQAAAVIERHPERAGESARLVQEQVGVARRHVDWHLARSRAAAAHGVPGMRVAVAPVLAGLLRVMRQVHAERHLAIECGAMPPDATFAGEEQDLQEILGNVLDNACKWARRRVQVSATAQGEHLQIDVDDDGPGIDPARRDAVLARGARIDESVPGAGLGLAIVLELVTLYRGTLALGESPLGGLRVGLRLPGGGGR